MSEYIGYVYLTTNLLNGKQYVGQHLSDGFDKYYKGSGIAITHAINKYGWDNFNCEVICWCSTQTQLNEAEDNYIKLLGTMFPKGYNLKGGGSHGRYSKEAKEKMSKAQKKYFSKEENRKKASELQKKRYLNPDERRKLSEAHKGKHHTKETRQKNLEITKKYYESDENRKKHSETMKKYYKSEEARKKISKTLKKYYESEETREKNSKAHKKYAKAVLQYTKDGEFVKEWFSINEVGRVLCFDIGHISRCCNGNRKSYKGFIWKYKTTD